MFEMLVDFTRPFSFLSISRKKQIAATRNLSLYPRLRQSGRVIIAAIVIITVILSVCHRYHRRHRYAVPTLDKCDTQHRIILYDKY